MKRSQNKQQNKRKGGNQIAKVSFGPSQLKTNIEYNHHFRYTSSSGTATAITGDVLIPACGVVATSAVVGHSINQSVKVNKIEVWAPPASQGAFATCSILYPGTNQSQAREITDTSVSVTEPAHIVSTPPAKSLCSFWTNGAQVGGANDPLFTLTAPSGSIIDVWVSLILNDGVSANDANVTATLVGATVGGLYYTSLDSTISAGSIYKPVGLTTL